MFQAEKSPRIVDPDHDAESIETLPGVAEIDIKPQIKEKRQPNVKKRIEDISRRSDVDRAMLEELLDQLEVYFSQEKKILYLSKEFLLFRFAADIFCYSVSFLTLIIGLSTQAEVPALSWATLSALTLSLLANIPAVFLVPINKKMEYRNLRKATRHFRQFIKDEKEKLKELDKKVQACIRVLQLGSAKKAVYPQLATQISEALKAFSLEQDVIKSAEERAHKNSKKGNTF